MSHLTLVVALKEELNERGYEKLEEHNTVIAECFTRAIHASYATIGGDYEDFIERTWKQLEYWNSVTPIPAQFVISDFTNRVNNIRGSLMKHGTVLNGVIPQTITFPCDDGTTRGLTFDQFETIPPLVDCLKEEFKRGEY